MISQIGSIAISLAGGLIFSSFIFLGLFKKFKNQTYLQVAERAILATSYCIFLAFFCLLNELLISNFNLQYVAQYTSMKPLSSIRLLHCGQDKLAHYCFGLL